MPDLNTVARQMVEDGRGILAADESIKTMSSRLEAEGVEGTEKNRNDYRELLLTADGLSAFVSGVIWCDETFTATMSDGSKFADTAAARGIFPGIKVDTGVTPLAGGGGATITEGLDGLGARLEAYAAGGAAFAKWRAVIDITNATAYSHLTNAHALARYAALCQANGIVPIVEPEVLTAGSHDIDTCAATSTAILTEVFDQLDKQNVDLTGIVLKPNMVTPGLSAPGVSVEEVAARTLEVLTGAVPADVPGIAFLSGGHATENVCAWLAEMNKTENPWSLTFSFGRALVSGALHTWGGKDDQVTAGQDVLLDACRDASKASRLEAQPA